MEKHQIISIAIDIISTLLVLVGVIYAGIQLRHSRIANNNVHEWNRRKTTYDLLKDFSNGDFPKILMQMRQMTSLKIDENTNYKMVLETIHEDERYLFDKKLNQLLNYFEGISISIKNHIIDEDICFDYAGVLFERYYTWSKEFIKRRRSETEINTLYANFEFLSKKWIKVKKEEKEKIEKALISEGKGELRS